MGHRPEPSVLATLEHKGLVVSLGFIKFKHLLEQVMGGFKFPHTKGDESKTPKARDYLKRIPGTLSHSKVLFR
jgi:hypothetical protein